MRSGRSREFTRPSKSDGDVTYRVVVEYDGTDFCGFQFQPGRRTVAGVLEKALSRLFDRPLKITAAGRTDTGVHARGQVISFAAHGRFPNERLAVALSSALPGDVSARDAALAAPGFSARFDALERRYTYVVLNRPTPSAVLRRFSHHEHRALDDAVMQQALGALVGTHDFTSFCGVLPEGSPVRTLSAASVRREGELVCFDLRADGFLHRMVRVIIGTVLEAGAGHRTAASVAAALGARDRRAAGLTAPPSGLFLEGVRYPDFDSARGGNSSIMPDRSDRR